MLFVEINIGEAGTESGYDWELLPNDLECSVSEASDSSEELLRSL